MNVYEGYSKEQLKDLLKQVEREFQEYKQKNLNLDMSRGKPCKEQLDLADGLYDNIGPLTSDSGIDCRNYGGVEGLPEARKLFAELLDVKEDELIIGGNSSLNLMYDTVARTFNHGVADNFTPWNKLEKIKFLCPSPGYDRHFAITELFGVEMITIPYNEDGPDMDLVEELVSSDESIKGMWCVPKYSNPTGIVYSDSVVERLAAMKTSAEDFRIFYDNAYTVHHLTENPPELKNIIRACEEAGNPDRVFMFASTSKITYAGAGLSFLASSKKNIDYMVKLVSKQTIGPNKINQLLHIRFFKSVEGILEHMKKHAEILKPKFDTVLNILEKNLAEKKIATWTYPQGGYFISLNVMNGCARQIVELAQEAGVKLTGAGATYPYRKDPEDSNIRIAPTFPPIDELEKAIEIVCTCVEKVTLEKLLA